MSYSTFKDKYLSNKNLQDYMPYLVIAGIFIIIYFLIYFFELPTNFLSYFSNHPEIQHFTDPRDYIRVVTHYTIGPNYPFMKSRFVTLFLVSLFMGFMRVELAFLTVNTIALAAAFMFLYYWATKEYEIPENTALLFVLSLIPTIYVIYYTWYPITDSITILCSMLIFYSFQKKNWDAAFAFSVIGLLNHFVVALFWFYAVVLLALEFYRERKIINRKLLIYFILMGLLLLLTTIIPIDAFYFNVTFGTVDLLPYYIDKMVPVIFSISAHLSRIKGLTGNLTIVGVLVAFELWNRWKEQKISDEDVALLLTTAAVLGMIYFLADMKRQAFYVVPMLFPIAARQLKKINWRYMAGAIVLMIFIQIGIYFITILLKGSLV